MPNSFGNRFSSCLFGFALVLGHLELCIATEIYPRSKFTTAHRALKALNFRDNFIKLIKSSTCLKLSPCFKCPDELNLNPKPMKCNTSFRFHFNKFGLQSALDFKSSHQLVLNVSLTKQMYIVSFFTFIDLAFVYQKFQVG